MRFSLASAALAALSCSPAAQALHILLNNDDGWASANIRETYRLLKEAGHDVLMVAPVVDNSDQGGRSVFSTSANLTTNGEFDSVLAGAPALGPDPLDDRIWYYNGTPAACTFVNLDYVMPRVWPDVSAPDLLASGPNVGQNLGSFLYTLSGTMGATYYRQKASDPVPLPQPPPARPWSPARLAPTRLHAFRHDPPHPAGASRV